MKIKRAGEVMIPLDEYPHIPYWFTLRQAFAEMESSKSDSSEKGRPSGVLLVFNEKYQLLGVVQRGDILRGLELQSIEGLIISDRKRPDSDTAISAAKINMDKIVIKIKDRAERPISDVMGLIKGTVDYEDSIINVLYAMVYYNSGFLPVIKENNVVGIITEDDVFHEVATLLLD